MSKSGVMNAVATFATIVTGVTNFKPIMKFVFVIDVTPFIARDVMKWINVMIVVKWSVAVVVPCSVANFVVVDCARIVLQLADGTFVNVSIMDAVLKRYSLSLNILILDPLFIPFTVESLGVYIDARSVTRLHSDRID